MFRVSPLGADDPQDSALDLTSTITETTASPIALPDDAPFSLAYDSLSNTPRHVPLI